MKYRIIEETDGVGDSVFFAQYETSTFFGKKWNMVYDSIYCRNRRFASSTDALLCLKRYIAPKISKIVDEGDL